VISEAAAAIIEAGRKRRAEVQNGTAPEQSSRRVLSQDVQTALAAQIIAAGKKARNAP
jgi:hypothetical protein